MYKIAWFHPEKQFELFAFRKTTMRRIPADDQSGPLGYPDLRPVAFQSLSWTSTTGSKWWGKIQEPGAVTSPRGCSGVQQQLKLLPYLRECFWHPFLVTQPDSIKCSMCRLPMRSSTAADEAHQTMTTTWESHWNAESRRTFDCMLSGKRISNSCKCVVSTPGHVLRNWKVIRSFLGCICFCFIHFHISGKQLRL